MMAIVLHAQKALSLIQESEVVSAKSNKVISKVRMDFAKRSARS